MANSKVMSRPRLDFSSPSEWRDWLGENHQSSDGVWLVFRRSAKGPQPLTQRQALEEALCYGWIDSQMKPLDEGRFIKLFTPRGKGSTWSQVNIDLARKLIVEKRMAPAGERAIDWGQEGWEKEFDTVPSDLLEAVRADERAWRYFQDMPQGRRRIHIHWIMDAKTEGTRRKRIGELVHLLSNGGHLGMEYQKRRGGRRSGKA